MLKLAETLTENDFLDNPVWKFVNDDEKGETCVSPMKKIPAANLDGKLVGCPVTFANGSKYFAMFGNVDTKNSKMNLHFLSISIWNKKKWVHLARYFDPDFNENGPNKLSKVIGLKKNDIFPITYDLKPFSNGLKSALVGKIFEKPKQRLNKNKLLDFIVSNL